MSKKRYEHIGILPLEITQPTGTLRVETGETFEADLPDTLEQFFLRAGLVREVPADATSAQPTATTYEFPTKKKSRGASDDTAKPEDKE